MRKQSLDLSIGGRVLHDDGQAVNVVVISYGELCEYEIPVDKTLEYLNQALVLWSQGEFLAGLTRQAFGKGMGINDTKNFINKVMDASGVCQVKRLGQLIIRPASENNEIVFHARIPGWDDTLSLTTGQLIKHAVTVHRVGQQIMLDNVMYHILTTHYSLPDEIAELAIDEVRELMPHDFLLPPSHQCPGTAAEDRTDV